MAMHGYSILCILLMWRSICLSRHRKQIQHRQENAKKSLSDFLEGFSSRRKKGKTQFVPSEMLQLLEDNPGSLWIREDGHDTGPVSFMTAAEHLDATGEDFAERIRELLQDAPLEHATGAIPLSEEELRDFDPSSIRVES